MLPVMHNECREKGRENDGKTRQKMRGVNRSPKGLRLKERDVANGREEDCYERKRESPQWENKDNGRVCVVFVTVAFRRTEGPSVCIRFPIHSICGIDPLPNSEQNKIKKKESPPNPTTIYNTDGREERDTI